MLNWTTLYVQEMVKNLIVPIFKWQIQVFLYERRVYKKVSARSYEKYKTLLTEKGIISLTIRSFFLNFLKYWNQILYKNFLIIIITLICRTLRLSIIIPFNFLKFTLKKKVEKEKLNTKSGIYIEETKIKFTYFFSYTLRKQKEQKNENKKDK